MQQQQPRTWQELLALIMLDPTEKQRIATELGVNPLTLDRWVKGLNAPSSLKKLGRLVAAIPPELRQQFSDLISMEYTDFSPTERDAISKQVSRDFYPLLIRTRKETSNRFSQLCFLTLQAALVQLDNGRLGTEIIVLRCMPLRNGKVRSLREACALGNRPWRGDLQLKHLFLGAESLAGYSVTTIHQAVVQDIEKDTSLVPIHQVKNEKSAAAFPIVCEGAIAGCLLITSTQLNFFIPERLALLAEFADALALAFRDADFYPPSAIELRVMPPYEVQERAFASFDKRRSGLLERAKHEEQPLDAVQAGQLVQEELEEEFLQWHPLREGGRVEVSER